MQLILLVKSNSLRATIFGKAQFTAAALNRKAITAVCLGYSTFRVVTS